MKKLSIKNIKRLPNSQLRVIMGGETYGSRGTNGVVVIKTKTGSAGTYATP